MNEIQARNLIRAIHHVEGLPHDKFCMPGWCSGDATETDCGTAGCFAGHCVNLFHEQGFVFKELCCFMRPTFGGHAGDEAFAKFFRLSLDDAMAMSSYFYRTEGDAIAGAYLLDADGAAMSTRPVDVANRARMILEKNMPGFYAKVEAERAVQHA